jgi:glycosyltransferase involved in cell wall biosynthesis
MGEAGRARAPEFSWERVTEQVIDFYREVRTAALSSGAVLPR